MKDMMKIDFNEYPLISVVVPVFNAELYLPDCIDSLINQTYKKLEIILVNDGSTDDSSDIADNYAKKDQRIRVIHKENNGVSSARNVGLENISGKYILFVDSDDWIDENMVEAMVRVIESKQVDLVVCGMRHVTTDGRFRNDAYSYHPINKVLQQRDVYLELIKELFYGGGSLCCRLMNSDLVTAYRFNEEMRISEDQEWLLRIMNDMKTGVYIPNIFYNVRMRPKSATTISAKGDIDDIEVVSRQIAEWAYRNNSFRDKDISNVLFVRSRLKYSAAIRSKCRGEVVVELRNEMKMAYSKTKQLTVTEKIKYYISLLPPKLYSLTRLLIKKTRKESV